MTCRNSATVWLTAVRWPTGVSGLILAWVHSRRRTRADAAAVDLRDPTAAAEEARAEDARQRHARALAVLEQYLPERSDVGDVLVANDVSIAFGGLQALSDVSLTVPTRKLVGLIGPNGAGKSTLFDILNGLRQPDSGSVLLFGQDVSQAPPWDRAALGLSRTFQSSRVNLDLTVGENLRMGAFRRLGKESLKSDYEYVFAIFPRLQEREKQVAGTLSGGEQQMLAIGRALLSKPRYLMLDEPSLGIAPILVKTIFEKIVEINRQLGITILLVEQNANLALEISDYGYVLETGRVILEDPSDRLRTSALVKESYLGG